MCPMCAKRYHAWEARTGCAAIMPANIVHIRPAEPGQTSNLLGNSGDWTFTLFQWEGGPARAPINHHADMLRALARQLEGLSLPQQYSLLVEASSRDPARGLFALHHMPEHVKAVDRHAIWGHRLRFWVSLMGLPDRVPTPTICTQCCTENVIWAPHS